MVCLECFCLLPPFYLLPTATAFKHSWTFLLQGRRYSHHLWSSEVPQGGKTSADVAPRRVSPRVDQLCHHPHHGMGCRDRHQELWHRRLLCIAPVGRSGPTCTFRLVILWVILFFIFFTNYFFLLTNICVLCSSFFFMLTASFH